MKVKRIIELVAPDKLLTFDGRAQTETITGDAVRCEYCNGEGGTYTDSRSCDFDAGKNNGEGYYTACTICKGSGLVRPIITVEWKPAGKVKDCFRE